jgi:hypothetical protein
MAMIDQHEPRPKDGDSDGDTYEPTPAERKAIKLVNTLFDKSKDHRKQYDSKWMDYYKMFRGRQWKYARPTYRHQEVINKVFRIIQSLVPLQTDVRPKFEFLPREPGDRQLAQVFNKVAEADWDNNLWGDTLLDVIYDANIYGTGMSEMTWDPKANFGLGNIKYTSTDPFNAYPDPDACAVNEKADFFIEATARNVMKVKREFPEVAKYLKADLLDIMAGLRNDLSPERFRVPMDNKTLLTGQPETKNISKMDQILEIIAYIGPEFLEDEIEEIKGMEPDDTGTMQEVFIQKKKYPNGRRLRIANNVLLEDIANPYEDGKFPYSRYTNYVLPREFWGVSEVEQLEGPQSIFNKVYSFALDVLTFTGNPIWLFPTGAGINYKGFTDRPGAVIPYDGDQPPTRVEGTQLQPYVLQLARALEGWMDDISGDQDVSRGVKPAGVTAARAIEALQETSHTRIRQKQRILDRYLQDVGKQYLSRVFQYYTAPRVFRLTNDDESQQFFKFNVERDNDGRVSALLQPLTEDGLVNPDEVRQFYVTGEFDVKVVTGSDLPFAKAERATEVLNLFDRGIVDEEEVLKRMDYPNREAVLERLQQRAEEAALAEAEAAGAAPAGPPV